MTQDELMNTVQTTENSSEILIGYILVGAIGALTLLHMGIIAIFLAIGSVFYLNGRIKRSGNDIQRSHLRWQKRTALILIISMATLISWFTYELFQMNEQNFILIIGSHWLAHTLLSIITAIWMLIRVFRGLLRHADRRAI